MQASLLPRDEIAQKPLDPDSMLGRVALHFVAHRGDWIDSEALAHVGGRCAWRTRVSECRTLLNMEIENRVRTVRGGGQVYRVSEYRYGQ